MNDPLNKQCTCGTWLTKTNAKFIGLQEGQSEIGCDLELWDCRICGSTMAIRVNERIPTDEEIATLENDLIRKGFFNEAEGISDHLKSRWIMNR